MWCYIQLALDEKLCGTQGTQWNYQETMYMYPYVHVHKQHRTRNNLNIKPVWRLSFKAFKVVLKTKNITVQKIMQQYNM